MRDHYYDGKKKYSRLSGGCAIVITTEKKKIQLSFWLVRDRYYDRKIKKFQWFFLAGVRSLLRPENKKSSSHLSGRCAIVITTRKLKVPFVCLVGARSLLRPEKKKDLAGARLLLRPENKKFQSSVWRVRNRYYDQKKRYSRLPGRIVITTGKKKVPVLCLAGARL